SIWMRNQHNGMLTFLREMETPNIELVFHPGTSRLQPFSKTSSSLALARVRYFLRLPRGKVSAVSFFTMRVRRNRPSPCFSYAKTCFGFASGKRTRFLESTTKVCMVGNSHEARASSRHRGRRPKLDRPA